MAVSPIRVAITGAAGNIGYALLYRIANGDLFGPDQPVALNLLEITPAMKALEGVGKAGGSCLRDAFEYGRALAAILRQDDNLQTHIGRGQCLQPLGTAIGAAINDHPHRIPLSPRRPHGGQHLGTGVIAGNQDKMGC